MLLHRCYLLKHGGQSPEVPQHFQTSDNHVLEEHLLTRVYVTLHLAGYFVQYQLADVVSRCSGDGMVHLLSFMLW